jgi:hypothetical protein
MVADSVASFLREHSQDVFFSPRTLSGVVTITSLPGPFRCRVACPCYIDVQIRHSAHLYSSFSTLGGSRSAAAACCPRFKVLIFDSIYCLSPDPHVLLLDISHLSFVTSSSVSSLGQPPVRVFLYSLLPSSLIIMVLSWLHLLPPCSCLYACLCFPLLLHRSCRRLPIPFYFSSIDFLCLHWN